ncbi:unnamed protein product [Diamesa hyperborea]
MDPTESTEHEDNIYRQQKIECMIRYYNKLAEAGGLEPINLEQLTTEMEVEKKRKQKEAYAELLKMIKLMAYE